MAQARSISDCTDPDELLAAYPCLNCVSNFHELLIILVGMFAVVQDLDGDLDDLLEASKKYRNMGDLEMMQALISALPSTWFDALDSENLGQDFSCWRCLGDVEIKAIGIYLWCNFWKNLGVPN